MRDRAASLRAAAQVVAAVQPKQAFELLDRADALIFTEVSRAPQMTEAQATAAYAAATGIDWNNPDDRDKVYRAVEEMRRRALDRAGKLEEAQARLKARKATRGKRLRSTPRPPHGG